MQAYNERIHYQLKLTEYHLLCCFAATDLKPSDPMWLGAWWLGMLILQVFTIIFSIPLFFFPKRLKPAKPTVDELQAKAAAEEQKGDEPLEEEPPKGVERLKKNFGMYQWGI